MVVEKARVEARNAWDVGLDMQSRVRGCKVDSNGRSEICERAAAIVRAQSDLSIVTSYFWTHVRSVVVTLVDELAGM